MRDRPRRNEMSNVRPLATDQTVRVCARYQITASGARAETGGRYGTRARAGASQTNGAPNCRPGLPPIRYANLETCLEFPARVDVVGLHAKNQQAALRCAPRRLPRVSASDPRRTCRLLRQVRLWSEPAIRTIYQSQNAGGDVSRQPLG